MNLIEKVESFDKAAAEYMRSKDVWWDKDAVSLAGAFSWEETPQGYDYWRALDAKIIARAYVETEKDTKENKMNVNSTVARVFKDVDDAILVTKYLGREYEEGNHRAYLDLKANDKAVLAEVKRLEKEEKDNK